MKDKGKKKKSMKKSKVVEKEHKEKENDEFVDFTIGNESYESDWDLGYDYDDSDYTMDYSS